MTFNDLITYYELRSKQCHHMCHAMDLVDALGWTDDVSEDLAHWVDAMYEADKLGRKLGIPVYGQTNWADYKLIFQSRGIEWKK